MTLRQRITSEAYRPGFVTQKALAAEMGLKTHSAISNRLRRARTREPATPPTKPRYPRPVRVRLCSLSDITNI